MSAHPISSVALLLAHQWPQFCTNCNRECTHGVSGTERDGYRMECWGCGVETLMEFSHSLSEES